jgi:DNA primase
MSAGRFADLDEVKRIPIGEVARRLGIQVRGRSARCPYPQHTDHNPSFQLYPDENRCWCHRCGAGGSVIDLVSLTRDLSTGDAIRWLRAEYPGFDELRSRPSKSLRKSASRTAPSPARAPACEASPEIYAAVLDLCPINATSLAYVRGRGFTDATIQHFRLGSLADARDVRSALVRRFGDAAVRHAGLLPESGDSFVLPSPSIIFPFFEGGHVQYLQARRLPDGASPKWTGPRGVPKPVFNFSVISSAGSVYICEGATDVMAAHQLGHAAIGLLGATTPLPMAVIRALRGRSIYIVPDKDEAGEKMLERVKAQLRSAGLSATSKRLPVGEDLSDYLRMHRGWK